jgi:hypothetical protein
MPTALRFVSSLNMFKRGLRNVDLSHYFKRIFILINIIYVTVLFLTGYMLVAVFCPVLPAAAFSISLIVLFSLSY